MPINRTTFDSWVRDYSGNLYRHALWMIGQRELAEELVQETFFQAWKSPQGPRQADRTLPWLLTILRRAIYKEYQIINRHSTTPHGVDAEYEAASETENPALLIDLARGLRSLSLSHRELLLLYGLHGFSYEEISEYLDIPLGTVMSRLSRARHQLQEFLNKTQADNILPFHKDSKTHHG